MYKKAQLTYYLSIIVRIGALAVGMISLLEVKDFSIFKVKSNKSTMSESLQTKSVEVTDANFSSVVQSIHPVLIDFWAAWCAPCQMIAPVIEELAAEYQGKAVIGKLDVDLNPQKRAQYKVKTVPTLMIFKQGTCVHQWVGRVSKNEIAEKLSTYIDEDKEKN